MTATTGCRRHSLCGSPRRATSSAFSGPRTRPAAPRGVKRLNHPNEGELELNYGRLDVMADPSLTIVV